MGITSVASGIGSVRSPSTFDRRVFGRDAASPESLAANAAVAEACRRLGAIESYDPRILRQMERDGTGISAPPRVVEDARVRTIPWRHGELKARVFVPKTVSGVYLHFHGGGFVIGAPILQDVRNWQIARHCQVAVVSVDYPLAPEYPYPAAPDACEDACLWVIERFFSEVRATDLVVGGESAGATLALSTQIRMRDRHGYATAGASLYYGWYDLSLTPSAQRARQEGFTLSASALRWFAKQYVADERLRDPDVSPLFADLGNLAPVLLTVGTLDPLLDDSLFLFSRLVAAGNDAEIAIYPGGIHAFNALPTKISREANARAEEFVISRTRRNHTSENQ